MTPPAKYHERKERKKIFKCFGNQSKGTTVYSVFMP